MGALLLAAGGVYGGLLPSLLGPAQAARPPPPKPLPPCNGPLYGQLAADLTRAVYSSVVKLQVMDEEDFQRENFKLREREYRYYAAANRPQLPLLPDLADNTGGLSNPAYFNFIHYCLWKVVYRHVTAPEAREAFARAAAAAFLDLARVDQQLEAHIARKVGGGGDGAAAAGAAAATPAAAAGAAVPAVIHTVVLPFLELLRAGGYICCYQIVLGSHPGSWPQDWMVSQPVVLSLLEDGEGDRAEDPKGGAGDRDDGARPGPEPASDREFLFQLKLHRPADILGSVALRSEEGGAWPHTVSSCLQLLLERRAGYQAGPAATTGPGLGAEPAAQQQRKEQQEALAGASKDRAAECDEFFYQDQWQGPASLADKLLLFFGDPLEQVGVDFVPTTLVQNWRLRGQ